MSDSPKCDSYSTNNLKESPASSANASIMSSPEHHPGRVGTSRNVERKRRPSDDLIPDPQVLQDLEIHARAIASNMDMCMRDLRGTLRGMSDLTLENIQTFSSCIDSTCNVVDSSIKGMYKLLAKTEELQETITESKKIIEQINDMKRLVEAMESHVIAQYGVPSNQ